MGQVSCKLIYLKRWPSSLTNMTEIVDCSDLCLVDGERLDTIRIVFFVCR